MATITIRRLADDVHSRLKTQAKNNGRSLEAEARHILGERVGGGGTPGWIERLRDLQQRQAADVGILPDSLELIRQMRDEE